MVAPVSRRVALSFLAAPALAPFAARASLIPGLSILGPEWTRTGAGGDPDYGPWAAFLSRYVRAEAGRPALVDYAGALEAGADRALADWLAETQRIDPATLEKTAQRAWWTNLYNAATVDLVLRHYPVTTIRRIKGGLFNLGPWDEEILTINDQRLSLDDVEHRILRPIWGDPRIHYAVNCASIGCPDLAPAPWTSAGMEAALDAAARRYVNHPRGARVENGRLIVSSIYRWFREDFGGTEAGVIAHLKRYAAPALAARLAGVEELDGHNYDWTLNGRIVPPS